MRQVGDQTKVILCCTKHQERQCTGKSNIEVRLRNHCVRGKYYVFEVCVCGLCCRACSVHAPYLSSVTFLVLSYFATLCQKRQEIRSKITGHKICVSISSTIFV